MWRLQGGVAAGTDLVLAVEVGESLEPGGVLLPRILHEGPAHTLQHLQGIVDGRLLCKDVSVEVR